jgi:diguanylate cyclase (GGDEF)-like protein/PAS domain S-box-containing protein
MKFIAIDRLNDTLSPLYAYLLAIAFSLLAFGFREIVLPAGSGNPFAAFYPFVILSFYVCGTGPGVATIIFTAMSPFYLFPWRHETFPFTSETAQQILLYLIAAGSCGYIIKRLHQYRRELSATHESLLKTRGDSAAYDYAIAVEGGQLGVWRFIPGANVYTFSDRFAEHFGLPVGVLSVSYEKLLSLVHPEDRSAVHHALITSIEDKTDFSVEHRVILPDGSFRWIYLHGKPARSDTTTVKQIDGVTVDITERKLADLENKANLSLIKATFDSASEAILIGDLEGNLQSYNEAAIKFFRFKPAEPFFKTMAEFSERFDFSTRDDQPLEQPFQPALREIQKIREVKIRSKRTGETWYALTATTAIRNEKNEIIGAASTALDISNLVELQTGLEDKVEQRTRELASVNQKLVQISRHDSLTGLNNKMSCNEKLRTEFERMKRTKETYAVLMVDIDFFKNVNDKFGHIVGDDVLKFVSDTLSKNLRKYDFIARWGGEEFLILLPATQLDQARVVAEKLRSSMEAGSHPIAGKITISMGVAITSPDQENEEVCVIKADGALYEAKRAGRNRVKESAP